MGDDWDKPYSDPEDDEEAERAAQRERIKIAAWGDGDTDTSETREDEIKRMARSHAELAMMTLADVAANGVKDASRVAASKELLARGFGATLRKVEQKIDVKIQDQRAAHFEALKQLAKENPVIDIQDAEFTEIPETAPRQISKRRSRDDDDD